MYMLHILHYITLQYIRFDCITLYHTDTRTHRQTNKQTNKQTNERTNEQTNKQTDRSTSLYVYMCKILHTYKIIQIPIDTGKHHTTLHYISERALQCIITLLPNTLHYTTSHCIPLHYLHHNTLH